MPFQTRVPFKRDPIEVRYDLLYGFVAMIVSMVLTMAVCTTVIVNRLSTNARATDDALERVIEKTQARDGSEQQLFERIRQVEAQQQSIAKAQTENTEKIRAILTAVKRAQ